MSHYQVTALWSGWSGAPGYTRMRFTADSGVDVQADATAMQAWFSAVRLFIPSTISISWDGAAPIFDENGNLTEEDTYTPPAPVQGGLATGTGYSAATGFVVDWMTSSFRNNRRVRGRTFLVPAVGFQLDGTVLDANRTTVTNASNTLVGAAPMIVWSRPPTGATTGGAESPVESAVVPDKAAVMRSRRD